MLVALAKSGYDINNLRNNVVEISAKLMAGKLRDVNATPEQAAKFLNHYFSEVVHKHGDQALDNLVHTHGEARRLQYEFARRAHEGAGAGTGTTARPIPSDYPSRFSANQEDVQSLANRGPRSAPPRAEEGLVVGPDGKYYTDVSDYKEGPELFHGYQYIDKNADKQDPGGREDPW